MKSGSDPTGRVSIASAQGARSHQEDRPVSAWIKTPAGTGWLLAIFDGHRGAASAEAASKALVTLFEKELLACQGDIPRALCEVFVSLNNLTRDHLSGSTASVVFIPADAHTVFLAVLGDSPVAILDSRGQAHTGPDHNIRTNLKERLAAEVRGGVYAAGYLEDPQTPGIGLQMTRSLGDADLNRVILREPEIETVPLEGKGIVLVGSDGLLLPGNGPNAEQLKRILVLVQQGADADAVVADAVKRATGDNATAVVWRKD